MARPLKFLLFCVTVLGVPAALMAQGDAQSIDLGKLALILGPAVIGTLLNAGLGGRGQPIRWRAVGQAAVVTSLVAALALAAALLGGASAFSGAAFTPGNAVAAIAGTALTSVLEELGWAGGGLALATSALGRRAGVLVLGVVWAAWHLIPTFLQVGLFPELEAAPPAMLMVFAIACVVYRELLTRFVERSGSWLGAAAGHAAPNILLTTLVTTGLVVLVEPAAWPLFPAPGGVAFALLALGAVLWLRARGERA